MLLLTQRSIAICPVRRNITAVNDNFVLEKDDVGGSRECGPRCALRAPHEKTSSPQRQMVYRVSAYLIC